ncbi:hypothetical protein ABZ532_16920 [Streptomyces sp. NPDC019396]|uniref:hypothetical protein n=1 Tax=Streptomyces sp. NPDC019396 TaxID=3154687 RepID=UPI0033CA8CB3
MPDLAPAAGHDTYERLISLLDTTGTSYRLIDHRPEGATEAVSALRGHAVAEAAQCIILRVRPDRSLAVSGADYARLAKPRVVPIALP